MSDRHITTLNSPQNLITRQKKVAFFALFFTLPCPILLMIDTKLIHEKQLEHHSYIHHTVTLTTVNY